MMLTYRDGKSNDEIGNTNAVSVRVRRGEPYLTRDRVLIIINEVPCANGRTLERSAVASLASEHAELCEESTTQTFIYLSRDPAM